MSNMDKRLAEDGYVVYKSILDTQKLSEIRNEIVWVFNNQIKRLGISEGNFERNMIKLFQTDLEAYQYTGKTVQCLSSIQELALSPIIQNILKERCDIKFPISTTKPVCFFHNKNLAKEEVYYKTDWHQDFYSVRSSKNSVVLWIPLLPVTQALGPLRVVPKSHLKGPQWDRCEHSFGICPEPESYVNLPAELGDMVVFNQMLVHSSGLNTYEESIRWSINYRFADLEDPYWINNKYENPYQYKSNPKTFEVEGWT